MKLNAETLPVTRKYRDAEYEHLATVTIYPEFTHVLLERWNDGLFTIADMAYTKHTAREALDAALASLDYPAPRMIERATR
jgi:hypothetical protein